MKKLVIKTDFPFAHKGYERREYTEGQVVETDDEDFIAVAVREGWAEEAKELTGKPDAEADSDTKTNTDADDSGQKSKGNAPENKAKGK